MSAQEPKDFATIVGDMVQTYKAKNSDYGNSFEQTMDEFGMVALAIRLNDKVSRIKQLVKGHNPQVASEKLEDTLLDLANYAVMGIAYLSKHEVD